MPRRRTPAPPATRRRSELNPATLFRDRSGRRQDAILDDGPAAAPLAPAIRFDKISKTFPARRGSAEVRALDEVSLDVPAGAIVGIIGRSGAGKSTLIRLVNGLERPSAGRLLVG